MPISIRRQRLRLKQWMDLYDATEQWSEHLQLKRQLTLLNVVDDPEHQFQEVYRKEIWFRNDILEFLKSRKSDNEQENSFCNRLARLSPEISAEEVDAVIEDVGATKGLEAQHQVSQDAYKKLVYGDVAKRRFRGNGPAGGGHSRR
jgi:hypothetical protein